MTAARSFFRANRSISLGDVNVGPIFAAHPLEPGASHGVGNYVPDPTSAKLGQFCLLYTNFINDAVRSLSPNPIRDVRTAINTNLDFFLPSLRRVTAQVFPFGR
ncbi:hypothetical protein JB92DRAFT_2835628 [Gautieria morchelliformis]|nr:hypothetical protein JB92DRAFT_2835628 [Gautieria morchelliformis]